MEEINIKDFFNYLKKFFILLIALPLLAAGAIYLYDAQYKTPLYQSTAKVALIQSAPNSSNSAATLNEINANQKLISTYGVIAKSKLVLEPVIDSLHLEETPDELAKSVKVSEIDDTTILEISVTNPSADFAASIANEIAAVFSNDVEIIKKFNNVAIIESAEVSTEPANNTLVRDLVLAALLALFAVGAVLFLIFYFDDTVKYSDTLEETIHLPIVGKISKSDIKLSQDSSELVVDKYPKSVISESIRSLRTNLQFISVDKNLQVIHVTSSVASEGKSFISANLAAAFAQAGKKVLLVDCDLRKGRQHRIFHKSNSNGLSNLLTDSLTKRAKYIQSTNISNLSLLTRGSSSPNPSELLSSKKNHDLLVKLKKEFDIIILDSAPCGAVADPVIMSTLADATIIVSRNGKTPLSALAATKDALSKVEAKVAGVVVNGIDKKDGSYYHYYGGYYGDSQTSRKARR